MRIRKLFRALASMVVLGAAIASCGGSDSGTNPTPAGPSVAATAGNVFSPATLDISVGETVTWVFGAVDHDVIFNTVTGAPTNIAISRNKNVTRTFATAGTFPYICSLHAGMTGTIHVQ